MKCPSFNRFLVSFGITLAIISATSGNNGTLPPEVEEALESAPLARTDPRIVLKAWTLLEQRAAGWAKQWVKAVHAQFEVVVNKSSISSDCRQSLFRTLESVEKLEEWAIKLIDSWGKFPASGLMEGTVSDFGSFDECLSIEPNQVIQSPQYCTIDLRPLLPPRPRFHNLVHSLQVFNNFTSDQRDAGQIFNRIVPLAHFFYYVTLRVGICLPTKCNHSEVNRLATEVGKTLVLQGKAVRCEAKEPYLIDGYQVIALLILSLLTFLVFLGTTLDLFSGDKRSETDTRLKWRKYLLAFSIPRNFASVFNTKTSATNLGCLHGVRFITIAWVVMGHTYALTNHQTFARGFKITGILTEFSYQWFFNATLSVDTFFFISGLLTIYVTWSMTRGDAKNFNVPVFLLVRVFRLTPPLMVVVCFTFLLPLIGSGPGWHEMIDPVVSGCQKNWWTNLLYVNNYINTDNICLLHTWYLANDMHMHVMSLLVVLPLFKSGAVGMFINFGLLLGFTIITGAINYRMDYPPAMLYTQPEIEERWRLVLDFYFKPYSHVGAYCVGLATGFILSRKKFAKLSTANLFSGWCISMGTLFAVLFGVYGWNLGMESPPAIAALYSATHRTLWALGLAWIVYACVSGQGGFINRFLAWKGFVPLSRLTFMVYLVHPWLIWIYMGTLRQRIDTTHYTGFYIFVPHYVCSLALALVMTLLCEAPFMVIQRELLKHLTTSSERATHEIELPNGAGGHAMGTTSYAKLTNNKGRNVQSPDVSPYSSLRRHASYSITLNPRQSQDHFEKTSGVNRRELNTEI